MMDVGEREPRLAQTPGDSLRWEAGPVLDAAKTLLLGCRDKRAVAHQRCRRIPMEGVKAKDDHDAGACNRPSYSRTKRFATCSQL